MVLKITAANSGFALRGFFALKKVRDPLENLD